MERVSPIEKIPSLPQTYNCEEVARTAVREVVQEVQSLLKEIGEPSVENTITVLQTLLAEYGAVRSGTTVPLDNGNRYRAEAAAKMLSQVKAEKTFAEVMARTRLPGNDNLEHVVAA